jgi:hypothetical protein
VRPKQRSYAKVMPQGSSYTKLPKMQLAFHQGYDFLYVKKAFRASIFRMRVVHHISSQILNSVFLQFVHFLINRSCCIHLSLVIGVFHSAISTILYISKLIEVCTVICVERGSSCYISDISQANSPMFAMFLEDMQQKTTNVWRIPIQVVQENEGIANFKASKHHMWIQATRDPQKKWLEMQYCASREEVEWIVKD